MVITNSLLGQLDFAGGVTTDSDRWQMDNHRLFRRNRIQELKTIHGSASVDDTTAPARAQIFSIGNGIAATSPLAATTIPHPSSTDNLADAGDAIPRHWR